MKELRSNSFFFFTRHARWLPYYEYSDRLIRDSRACVFLTAVKGGRVVANAHSAPQYVSTLTTSVFSYLTLQMVTLMNAATHLIPPTCNTSPSRTKGRYP